MLLLIIMVDGLSHRGAYMDDIANQISQKIIADTKYFTAIIGLIGVLIGSFITVIGNLVLHWLSTINDTRQKIIDKELNRFFELEELAGEITERSGSYNRKLQDDKLDECFHKMDLSAGKFRRYSNMKQAIRDLSQYAKILVDCRRSNDDDRQAKKEMEDVYNKFIKEYITARKGVKL